MGNSILLSEIDTISEQPLLSIAIPTYQRPELLKEAIWSVLKLKFDIPVEILIVDNDPETVAPLLQQSTIDCSRFRYFKNTENLGMAGNWNQCLRLARGKYVTLLHDDDLLTPVFASYVNTLLASGTLEYEIIGFHVGMLDFRFPHKAEQQYTLLRNAPLVAQSKISCCDNLERRFAINFFFGNAFCGTLGVIMNRDLALKIGGFLSEWYPISDYEFWCRWVCSFGAIPIVNEEVGLYRIQENESLRADLHVMFVTKSTELRQVLIYKKNVPPFLRYVVAYLAKVQAHYIQEFWDLSYQRRSFFLNQFLLKKWRFFERAVCFFFRDYGTGNNI